MASLVSPTESTFSDRSYNASSRPRHSYSLFPTVEATPPTSPTILSQKAAFSRAALESHHRRRSSSMGSVARGKTPSRPVSINTSIAQTLLSPPNAAAGTYTRDARSAAMSTVHEVHSHASSPVQDSHPRGSEVRAAAISRCSEFDSESSQSIARTIVTLDTSAGTSSSPYDHESEQSSDRFLQHGADLDLPPTPSFQANRFRSRPGPNLKIAISRQDGGDHVAQGSHVDPPSRRCPSPALKTASHAPLSRARSTSSRSDREFIVDDSNRPAHQRKRSRSAKPLPSIHLSASGQSTFPPNSSVDSLYPIRAGSLPTASFPPRPSTANPAISTSSQLQHTPRTMPPIWDKPFGMAMPVAQDQIRSGDADAPRSIALPPGVTTKLKAKTSEPMLSSYNFTWKTVSPEETPESAKSAAQDTPPMSRSASSLANRTDLPDSISRVLAAKARIAALNISDPNIPDQSPAKENPSPVIGDATTHSRATTPASLRRRPSMSTFTDPAATLKELTEQTEALQLRYASLRTDRQALSASIVCKLQEIKPGPHYHNLLLDEQLSLAAVSSSMDICFAKLKALDCRKEDLVAALIAQAAAPVPRRYVPSSVPSLISNASTSSRKYSMGPSTGRLTGEFGDLANGVRLRRLPSYYSDSETSECPRLSQIRKLSIGSDNGLGFEVPDRLVVIDAPSEGLHRSGDLPLTPVPESMATTPSSRRRRNSAGESILDVAASSHRGTRLSSGATSILSDDLMTDEPAPPARKIRINATKAARIIEHLVHSANSDRNAAAMIKLIGDHDNSIYLSDDEDPTSPASADEPTDSTNLASLDASSSNIPAPPPPPRKYDAPLPQLPLPPLPIEHLVSCVKKPGASLARSTTRSSTSTGAASSTTTVAPHSHSGDSNGFASIPLPPPPPPSPPSKKVRGYSTQTLQTIQVYMDEDVLC